MTQKQKVDISEKTLQRIAEYFLHTSVPRIIAEEGRKKEAKNAS